MPKKPQTSADDNLAAMPEEAGAAADVNDLRALVLAFSDWAG